MTVQNNIDAYSINQIVDILLWSWIFLIMVKRSICKKFLPPLEYRNIFSYHHYVSDILLLVASLIAVCKFSDQLYTHLINPILYPGMLKRTWIWMIFHKLLTISLLFKYRYSQPKIFYILKEDFIKIKHLLFKKELT